MTLKLDTFSDFFELQTFVAEQKLTKEDVVNIQFDTDYYEYTLYYWSK